MSSPSSALRLSAAIAAVIFVVEFSITLIFANLGFLEFPLSYFIDAASLSVAVIPAVYFAAFRPAVKQTQKHREVEFELKSLVGQLETRVAEQTEAMVKTNQQLAADLRKRVRLEQMLRESQELYRALVEDSPEAIAVFSRDLAFLFVNPEALQMLGADRADQLIGQPARVHHDDRQRVLDLMGGTDPSFASSPRAAFRLVRLDNAVIDVEATFARVSFRGQPAFLAIARDITAQRRLEREVSLGERRFRTLVEQAAVGIALVNSEGRIEEANPALQRMLGYSRDELLKMDPVKWTDPLCLSAQQTLEKELRAGKRSSFVLEKRYIRKDGALVWGRLTTSLIDANDPQSLRIGMLEDVTERNRALEELSRQQREWDNIFRDGEWKRTDDRGASDKPGSAIT